MDVALIGYGYWGKILESYIIKSDVFNLKKIYDTSFDFDDEIKTKNLNEIILEKKIKAVFISTPVMTHFELSKLFLENGKHVFCEKPLELDYKKVIALKEIANKKKVKIETNYIYTDSESILNLKKKIIDIGEVTAIKGNITQYGNFYKDADVYSVLGCHLISTLFYIFDQKIEILDVENLLRDHYGNVSFGILMGNIKKIKFNLEFNLNSLEKKRDLTIYGKNGIAKFDMLGDKTLTIKKISKYNKITDEQYYFYDETNNIIKALNRFYNVISNEKESNIDLSINTTKILGAIYEKSK